MADEQGISSPLVTDAVVAVRAISDQLLALENTAADSAQVATVAAAQAVSAKDQTQLLMASATGGVTTPFTSTLLLAPNASNFKSQLGVPETAAPLVGGTIPSVYLPPASLMDVVTVASEAAMLALTPSAGSTIMAIRTDVSKTFVLSAGRAANVLANWTELPSPTGGITSVAGLTGPAVGGAALKTAMAFVKADVGLSNVPNIDPTNASNLSSGTVPLGLLPAAVIPYGRQAIFIPAAAMVPAAANGAAIGSASTPTAAVPLSTLDFDTTTQESAWFQLAMPPQWNEGTVTFVPVFSQASASAGNVIFDLAGVAAGDGASFDVAPGTIQTSTKTSGTANVAYFGAESAAITIAGTVSAGSFVTFRIRRVPASDTLAIDARLHGVNLFITTDLGHD